MANEAILSDKDWRFEIRDGAKSLGFWNRDVIKFGTEGGEPSWDPELGQLLRGGVDTIDDVGINRDWEKTRERVAFAEILAYKNRKLLTGLAWDIDPATNKPNSSAPLLTLQVMFREVELPKGEAGSADASKIVASISIQVPKP